MDIVEHYKNNKNWWFLILLSSFIINLVFPKLMYKDKSATYNVITNSLGAIVGGLIFFVMAYLIIKLFKKRLNEKQIKITLMICFAFWWTIQILNHFNFKIKL